ncbi:MAG: hypothetical protein KAS72_06655 [Phycisphaerales bacterium]|nr:hypothetical protein [Phycisphaerales bacterium]
MIQLTTKTISVAIALVLVLLLGIGSVCLIFALNRPDSRSEADSGVLWDDIPLATSSSDGMLALIRVTRYCDYWHGGNVSPIRITIGPDGFVHDEHGNRLDVALSNWKTAYIHVFQRGERRFEFRTAPSVTFSVDPTWPGSDTLGDVPRWIYEVSAPSPSTWSFTVLRIKDEE